MCKHFDMYDYIDDNNHNTTKVCDFTSILEQCFSVEQLVILFFVYLCLFIDIKI